uniref:Uncharacterized protein n=1 Tax=Cacopsylla melanoneura TaxID=428564 RepID=A0A8D8U9S4_9HEMI
MNRCVKNVPHTSVASSVKTSVRSIIMLMKPLRSASRAIPNAKAAPAPVRLIVCLARTSVSTRCHRMMLSQMILLGALCVLRTVLRIDRTRCFHRIILRRTVLLDLLRWLT